MEDDEREIKVDVSFFGNGSSEQHLVSRCRTDGVRKAVLFGATVK